MGKLNTCGKFFNGPTASPSRRGMEIECLAKLGEFKKGLQWSNCTSLLLLANLSDPSAGWYTKVASPNRRGWQWKVCCPIEEARGTSCLQVEALMSAQYIAHQVVLLFLVRCYVFVLSDNILHIYFIYLLKKFV